MEKLTKTDEKVLCFIKDFMLKNGFTPTIREICNGMGYQSPSTVHDHFKKLIKLGYIEQNNDRYRVKGMRYVQVDGQGSADMPCV